MVTEPQRSETMPGAPSSSEPAGLSRHTDVGADAALVLAALGRLEQAVRDERAVLGQLRTALRDMAHAIAAAKAVADSETAATLLDEFEHRVDAMIEIAGAPEVGAQAAQAETEAGTEPVTAAPEPTPAAELSQEPNEVPTVSGVVSQFGPTNPAPAADHAEPPQFANVAMLTAMVEALSAAMPHAAPQSETETIVPEPDQTSELIPEPPLITEPERQTTEQIPELQLVAEPEPQPTGTVPEPQFTAELEPPISEPTPEPEQFVEPVAAATAEPQPFEPEELLVADAQPQAREPEPIAATVFVPAVLPKATLMQETTLLASLERMETRPFPPPDEGTAVIFTKPLPEPVIAPMPDETEPPPAAALEPATEPAPEPTPEVQAESAPEPAPAEADFDPTDFLFGPEPEPDPAAFLLDPPPAGTPPQSDAAVPEAPHEPPASEQAAIEPAPHDPLRALKAMSPEERLAIFS